MELDIFLNLKVWGKSCFFPRVVRHFCSFVKCILLQLCFYFAVVFEKKK